MAEVNNPLNDQDNENTTTTNAERRTDNAAYALDAKLNGPLQPLETALDDLFGKKAAYQLPADIKDLLVKIAPWLSLLAGVLGIFSAFTLWRAAHYVSQWADSASRLSASLGVDVPLQEISLMFWLSFVMILVFAVLALLAFPGLKAKKKVGWNLMFYSLLANILYSIVSLFYQAGGMGTFLSTLIMSVVGLYILFQVRLHYTKP